jgi:small conductance mechanosensitive channel
MPTREFAIRQAARRLPAAQIRSAATEAARWGGRSPATSAACSSLGSTAGFEPGTAGMTGFFAQLVTLATAALVGLRLAGLDPGTLAAGAGFTAIVIGLATQQTFGNIFAGVVLVSARPFQVGERVRFAGFGMDIEGTVAGHGLLYVTLYDGDDPVLIPNNQVLAMSARPIRQPDAVDMRARLPVSVDPRAVQRTVDDAVTVPTKGPPHVELEELDGSEVVVRVRATPRVPDDGGRLAHDVLQAVAGFG